MQQRTLGSSALNSNLEVSAIGLGCMGMSFGYGAPADKSESESDIGRSASRDRGTEAGDARADSARMAACQAAVDRADTGNHEAGAPGGEHRRGCHRADTQRSP